jgi:hypothetical protein
VIEVVERTEGVHLGVLLDALEPDRRILEQAMPEILHDAATTDDQNIA